MVSSFTVVHPFSSLAYKTNPSYSPVGSGVLPNPSLPRLYYSVLQNSSQPIGKGVLPNLSLPRLFCSVLQHSSQPWQWCPTES